MVSWFEPFRNEPYLRRNFLANTFDGALYSFAMSFIALTTVMPVFVKNISGSNIYVGLIPVLWTLGFNFPQIIMANYVRKLAFKKRLLLITAIAQRLPWFFLAVFCWLIVGNVSHWLQTALFLILFLIAAVCGSINLPGWFDLIAKVTPVKLRGRLFAARALIGGLLGIIGGISVKYVLDNYPFPVNFGMLFFIAFMVMMISYLLLVIIKETKPNPNKEHIAYLQYLKRIPVTVRTNINFRNFLIADAMIISSLLADAFYALNGIEKFSLNEAYAGVFTIIMMGSAILGNILFGFIADKKGHKINLTLAAISGFSAAVAALAAPSAAVYLIVFVFAGFTTTLIHLSRLTIIAELCAEEDRPSYVAITNLITSPFTLLGIAGGWIANTYGYSLVFVIAGLFALTAALWLGLKVKEPRTVL